MLALRLTHLHLLEKFEEKLNAYGGNMKRAAIELAKDWRTDRYLRKLEAMMITANKEEILVISGTGDVLEPENGIAAIGSGGNYALISSPGFEKTRCAFVSRRNCKRRVDRCGGPLYLHQS